MKLASVVVALLLSLAPFSFSQAKSASAPQAVVPRLIRFSGTAKGATGTVGITFSLHRSDQDKVALWSETQNVQVDSTGKYAILLGSTKADGIPAELFTSGEAQWLAIRVEGRAEQPRVLLVSVPYALKAAEAETLAGHAATEFVTSDRLKSAVEQQVQEARFNTASTKSKAVNGVLVSTATNFTDTTTDQVVGVTQKGTGKALVATAGSNTAIYGYSTATSGGAVGVYGQSSSPGGVGLFGLASATTGSPVALFGSTPANAGIAIAANETAASGNTIGLQSAVSSPTGIAEVLKSRGGGKLISGQTGTANTEVFSVDGTGKLLANGGTMNGPLTFASGQGFPGALTNSGGQILNGYMNIMGAGYATPLQISASSTAGTYFEIFNSSANSYAWQMIEGGSAAAEGAGTLIFNGGPSPKTIFLEAPVNSGDLTSSFLHSNGLVRAETGLSLGGNATLKVDAPGIVGGQFVVQNNTMSINQDVPVGSNSRIIFTGYLFGDTGDSGLLNSVLGYIHPDRDIVVTAISGATNNKGVGNCGVDSIITLEQPSNPNTPKVNLEVIEGIPTWSNLGLSVAFSAVYDLEIVLTKNSGGCGFSSHTTQNPVISVQYYMK